MAPAGSFRTALALASEQGSKSLALRAAVSLAGVDRRADARQLLAAAYASLTEGRDTADGKDAQALLAGWAV